MTEPLSIFTAPPRSEQTATIPADLLQRLLDEHHLVGLQLQNRIVLNMGTLENAHKRVSELMGMHCETTHV